jgi:hypothetical protein
MVTPVMKAYNSTDKQYIRVTWQSTSLAKHVKESLAAFGSQILTMFSPSIGLIERSAAAKPTELSQHRSLHVNCSLHSRSRPSSQLDVSFRLLF